MSGPPNQDFPPQQWVPPQEPHQPPPPVPQQGWHQPPPYPQQGFPQPGFPQQGFQQAGFPPPGYPPSGFPPPLPRKSYTGLIVGLIAFGALAAIVLVGVAIILQPTSSPDGSGGSASGGGGQSGVAALPATRQPDGSVAVAKAGVSSPVLDIYEDFQCPVCKSFESTSGATLSDLATQGKVKLVYRPFRLFEQEPLRSNSERAANAAACAPAENWVALHRLLFDSQPPEGSDGFSAGQLITLGRQAGISDSSFSSCVGQRQKISEVDQSTKSALASGVQGTPTLRLNGTDLSTSTVFSPESLRSAILAKQGGGGSSAI